MRLETENVRKIERGIIDDLKLDEAPDSQAARWLAYISGVNEMASRTIEMILELGEK